MKNYLRITFVLLLLAATGSTATAYNPPGGPLPTCNGDICQPGIR